MFYLEMELQNIAGRDTNSILKKVRFNTLRVLPRTGAAVKKFQKF